MLPETQTVQVLVQAGAVGLALVSIFGMIYLIKILYKMSTNHTKHIESATDLFTKAMDRNTDSWLKNAEALVKLSEKIK